MEKLKKSICNIIFYILILMLGAAFVLLILQAIMKINCYAVENASSENICILIDPGHGGEDGGAVSDDGVVEKGINLAISNYLKEYYELSGFEVQMTRTDDTPRGDLSLPTIEERKRSDMQSRLEMYNSSDVDYVVSIHQNKFTESQYSGAQVFYSPNNEKSGQFAEYLRKSIVGFLQPDNERELKEAGTNIYLLNNCQNPAVLVECGFLSNPEETALLADTEYQRQMAFSIYCGTLDCIKNLG